MSHGFYKSFSHNTQYSVFDKPLREEVYILEASFTVGKRGSQRDSGIIFHLDEKKLLFHLGSWILVDFQILSGRVSVNSLVHFKFLRTPMILMMDRLKNSKPKWSTTMTTDQTIKEKIILRVVSKFTGEVLACCVKVYDDYEITEDDDEDVKGGR
ncbi:BnaA10g05630D [Brassica napus]|uniref:BnaA10g05630D protein n=1 Tax=Brassica napus TaxID=3708 RepID=A0A078HLM1_BRANA|nr:BnaA10g05630D [Brassica napus]